jgi:hypothetical protein
MYIFIQWLSKKRKQKYLECTMRALSHTHKLPLVKQGCSDARTTLAYYTCAWI